MPAADLLSGGPVTVRARTTGLPRSGAPQTEADPDGLTPARVLSGDLRMSTTTKTTTPAGTKAATKATTKATTKTTTKKELIDRIAEQTQMRRGDVKRAVQAFLDHVIEELGRGNRLEFREFGVFEIKERAARLAQNPKTLERVTVPPRRTVKFKVGRLMKESLDSGDSKPIRRRRAVADGE
jgi:integration host factor subunit beta